MVGWLSEVIRLYHPIYIILVMMIVHELEIPFLNQYQGMREGIQHGSKKNCSPFLIGKSTISMGHLYHGYVSHKQRVYCKYVTWGWGATHGDMTISMEGRSQSTHESSSKSPRFEEVDFQKWESCETYSTFRKFNLVDFNIQSCLIRTPV